MSLALSLCQYVLRSRRVFFFCSRLAVNALWHGPERNISGEKNGTMRNWPVPVKRQIKQE